MTETEWRTFFQDDQVRSLITPPGKTFGGLIVEGTQGKVIDQPTPHLVSVLFDGHDHYVYMEPHQIERVSDDDDKG